MADGDIKVYKFIGSVHTASVTQTAVTLEPTPPAIINDQHWLVYARIWVTYEDVLDDALGPWMRGLSVHMTVQDSGTNVFYNTASTRVLKAYPVDTGNNSDTFTMDYSGGIRVLVTAATTNPRRWFAKVTLRSGFQTVT